MAAREVGMHRDGDRVVTRFSDGTTVSVRVDWAPDDATDGMVHEWLALPEHARHAQFIRDTDREVHGVLLTREEYDEGQSAIRRINQDAYGQDEEGYKPFQHAPNATTDRIINTESLERVIRRLVHGKTADDADLTEDERDRIHYAALVAAIEFQFDADSRGIVPVMTPNRASDSMHREFIWSFLYPTPVPGLYLRPDDSIIGSVEYTLTAGSGYALVGGFWEREYAEELAVKLAAATPGQNWFQVDTDGLTAELRKTYVGVIREHGRWRKEADA